MPRPSIYMGRSASDESTSGQSFNNLGTHNQYSSSENWDPSILLDDAFVLPSGVTHLHDKHELDSIDRVEPESKRQELTHDSGKKKPGRKPILEEPVSDFALLRPMPSSCNVDYQKESSEPCSAESFS